MLRFFLAVIAIAAAAPLSAATITITVSEDINGNVVFNGTGNVDLDGASQTADDVTPIGLVNTSEAAVLQGLPPASTFNLVPLTLDQYAFSSGSFSPLTSTATSLIVGSLDSPFAVYDGGAAGGVSIFVDGAFADDDAILFNWTVQNTTIADLQVNFGDIATFGNNTVMVVQGSTLGGGGPGDPGTSPIPLPASALLLGAALPGLLLLRRRKRQT